MTDGKCDRCPVATIEKALTLEDGTAVILTGYVKSIDYAWSDANGNMSVTLRDETGDHTIYIFKLATKVSLGDYITVTGEKLNYNGTHEVVNGSALIITAHTECTPAADATCTDPSVCSICGALVAPALGHINDDTDDECDRCHTYVTVSTVWTLVTDVNELSAGDKIIIVSNDESYAMGGQNTNNRAAVAVTKNGSIVTFVTDVEVITLEATDTDGMFAFKVDEGYLYAASSSSNHLKTKSTLDVNGEWNVTIASGIATIKATNSDNRNWLRFNTSNSPKIFSCYSSGQKDVAIYKQSTAVVEAWGVTFDYNDDVTEDRVAVVADGSLVSKPTDPEMDGYNFAGWFTEAGAEFDFSAAVTESVTLVAKWEAKVYYDVIFNTDGGSSVATQRIETGYTATEPTTPTKDNHTFDGWYTDAECNTKFDFSTPITTNTTIYAKWISNELPKYNVTFETGDGSDVETQVITQGEKVSKPADPTLSNHAFGGWYTDEGCTEAYDFETKVTSAFTLYAKWIETVDFTITFDDTSKRTEFSTTAQVWEENGITVSNIKNTSTSNVADYCNPVRFYKNSKVTVQFENMTKIVFVCDSSSFASALQTSIGTVNGVTVEVSGSNVIVTFDTPVNAYSVVLSGGQVQVKSITVTAYAPCEHQSETGVEPVCGNTATCKLCGMVYTGAHSPITVEAVAATCITSGTTAGTKCNLCEITISGIETVGATGNHIYGDDGICTTPNCGEKKPSIPSTSEPVTVDVNFSELYSGNANLNGVEHKLDDVVSVTFAKNSGTTNPQYYTNGTAARLYGKNSVTISCAEGYKITSVIITTTSSNAITSSNCGSTDATMSISGTEVTLIPNAEGTTSIVLTNPNTSGNARIAAIEVTYEKIS